MEVNFEEEDYMDGKLFKFLFTGKEELNIWTYVDNQSFEEFTKEELLKEIHYSLLCSLGNEFEEENDFENKQRIKELIEIEEIINEIFAQ